MTRFRKLQLPTSVAWLLARWTIVSPGLQVGYPAEDANNVAEVNIADGRRSPRGTLSHGRLGARFGPTLQNPQHDKITTVLSCRVAHKCTFFVTQSPSQSINQPKSFSCIRSTRIECEEGVCDL